jgi:hypothetical protein
MLCNLVTWQIRHDESPVSILQSQRRVSKLALRYFRILQSLGSSRPTQKRFFDPSGAYQEPLAKARGAVAARCTNRSPGLSDCGPREMDAL